MHSITERNNRLTHIQSEINILQQLNGLVVTEFNANIGPDYKPDEKPNDIFDMEKFDLMQKNHSNDHGKSTRQNTEQQFYEKALDHMMNGVLEICWQDEIKKDPIKPHCLQLQIPEKEYSEIDHKEVHDYKAKMTKLRSDRESYIERLFGEKKNLVNALELQITQFNHCVNNSLISKIRTEFAIGSEELRLLLYSMDSFLYTQITNQEQKIT